MFCLSCLIRTCIGVKEKCSFLILGIWYGRFYSSESVWKKSLYIRRKINLVRNEKASPARWQVTCLHLSPKNRHYPIKHFFLLTLDSSWEIEVLIILTVRRIWNWVDHANVCKVKVFSVWNWKYALKTAIYDNCTGINFHFSIFYRLKTAENNTWCLDEISNSPK